MKWLTQTIIPTVRFTPMKLLWEVDSDLGESYIHTEFYTNCENLSPILTAEKYCALDGYSEYSQFA